MDCTLPGMIVTGASGFVGRNFLKTVTGRYRLFCIARRSQAEAGVRSDDNLRWTQVDIAEWEKLKDLIQRVQDHGGVDYIVHFAGYYDFTNKMHPEYTRTNVEGTRNVLELAKQLGIKRFLFASSLAACEFSNSDRVIDESSPPDADFPYALSKRAGEAMMREYSQWFPCTIIRMAAIFGDWCEYPPLYVLMNTWLSGRVHSRILGGHGQTAVPYIHIYDLIRFCLRIIEKNDTLPQFSIYNASPSGATSHLELFNVFTRYSYGQEIKPVFCPKKLLWVMMALRQVASWWFLCKLPFERLWMLDYVDKKLMVDSSRTFKELEWEPTPRYGILRRLLFLVENRKNNPETWHSWNEAALNKVAQRPDLVVHERIYAAMAQSRETVLEETVLFVMSLANQSERTHFQGVRQDVLTAYVRLAYQLVVTILCTRNRPMMRNYAKTIAFRPLMRGFGSRRLSNCLFGVGEIICGKLTAKQEFQDKDKKAYDYIYMAVYLAIDQIEDYYDLMAHQSPLYGGNGEGSVFPVSSDPLQQAVGQLENLCKEAISGKSWISPLLH